MLKKYIPRSFQKFEGDYPTKTKNYQISQINYSIAQDYITQENSTNFNSTRVFFACGSVAILVVAPTGGI